MAGVHSGSQSRHFATGILDSNDTGCSLPILLRSDIAVAVSEMREDVFSSIVVLQSQCFRTRVRSLWTSKVQH